MPYPVMSPVEGLGVNPVQLPHPKGEIPLRGLDEQMVMIFHEAVGVTEPVVASIHLVQKIQKTLPVLVIGEDGSPFVSSTGEVIDRPGVFDA